MKSGPFGMIDPRERHGASRIPGFAVFLLVALIALALPSRESLAASEDDAPTLFGTSGGGWRDYIPALVEATGRPPAFQGTFWTLDNWSRGWAQAELDDIVSFGAVPFIEVTTSDFDTFLQAGSPTLDAMASMLADWVEQGPSNRLLIAPFPEANLSQHAWGEDREKFLRGYRRMVDTFRSAGLSRNEARFVLALNGGIAEPLTYADYYPGDDYVDIVAFSKQNRNDPWRAYDEAFGRHIREIQEELTTTKPILAFQTGSVEEGGDRSEWLRDMFRNLKNEEQVIGAIYFNRNKPAAGKDNDYRIIVDGEVDQVVAEEYSSWSHPDEASWIFDGRMDAWVQRRIAELEASPRFLDIDGSIFREEIVWLAEQGITRGCNPPLNNLFCPNDEVTRGQMAAFLVRALGLSATGDREFGDDDDSVFEDDIEKLAEAGITLGCNPPVNDRFCPDDPVTRGQMAAFIVRAYGYSDPQGSFSDITDSVFRSEIEKLAGAGVTRGCNPPTNDRFCPHDSITRGQMAAFLERAG